VVLTEIVVPLAERSRLVISTVLSVVAVTSPKAALDFPVKLVSLVPSNVTVTGYSPASTTALPDLFTAVALLNAEDKSAPLSFPSFPLFSDLDSVTVILSLAISSSLPV